MVAKLALIILFLTVKSKLWVDQKKFLYASNIFLHKLLIIITSPIPPPPPLIILVYL